MTASPWRDAPDGIIRITDLHDAGLSNYAVSARCRPSGPWQRVLPGVVLMSTGPPTRRQRLRAAVTYAGAGSLITGADALRCQGIRTPATLDVHLLLPASRRAASRAYLTLERTARLPDPVWHNGLPLAPVTRATIDLARREQHADRLRAVLLAPLAAGSCTLTELSDELSAGSQRGTAAPRTVLNALAHQYSSGNFPSMSRT